MGLDYQPRYGEAESHAAFAGCLAGPGAHKRGKEPFLILWRNAGAFVTHGENQSRLFPARRKPDALAGLGVFNGVACQVDQNLLELGNIHGQRVSKQVVSGFTMTVNWLLRTLVRLHPGGR